MNLMLNILLNVIIAFLIGSILFGLQRKIMARIQGRPGPPVIQHLLHTLKFFIKESAFPKTAAMPFYIAITAMLCVIWVAAVIVGPVTGGSLLLIFAIYAIHKIVEHNAGSSSGSPYGKLSCVRAVYSAAAEVPLFAVLIIIYLKAGTMNITSIVNYQSVHGPLLFAIPLAALMFFVLILSKSPYSPFAITKGKDIISGYETEHFGLLRGYLDDIRIHSMVHAPMDIFNSFPRSFKYTSISNRNGCFNSDSCIYKCYNTSPESKPFCYDAGELCIHRNSRFSSASHDMRF